MAIPDENRKGKKLNDKVVGQPTAETSGGKTHESITGPTGVMAKPKSEFSKILEQLVAVKYEDFTLNFVFNNIRNHLTVVALAASGIFIWRHDSSAIGFQHVLHRIDAVGLILFAIALFVCNLGQMYMVLTHHLRLAMYLLFSLILFFISIQFVVSSVLDLTTAADLRYYQPPAKMN